MLNQLFAAQSDDPFLMLVEISHPSFATLYFVNNTVNITSRGQEYLAFPMEIGLPADNPESNREVSIAFDNASLELIEEIRSVTSPMDVKIEMILASDPDTVEIELGELKIRGLTYNKSRIEARLYMDDFLNTELSSEKYTPSNFPGIF
jgi:hypothetical protein